MQLRWLLFGLCLLAAPALAQEPEPETVAGVTRDWASLANAMRHATTAISALVQERNALAARVKELEAKLKPVEEEKK